MQKGRIRRGAKVSHSDSYGHWPACRPPAHEYYKKEYQHETKFPDAVFGVEWVEGGDQYYWRCVRFGYGLQETPDHNGYSNGAVLAYGIESVELIDD